MTFRFPAIIGAAVLCGVALTGCKDNGTVESQPGTNPVTETVTQSTQSSDAPPAASVDIQPGQQTGGATGATP